MAINLINRIRNNLLPMELHGVHADRTEKRRDNKRPNFFSLPTVNRWTFPSPMFFPSSFVWLSFLFFLLFRPALLFSPLPPIFPARELFTTANNSRGKNVVARQHHLFSSVSFIVLDYKNIRHDNSSNAKWLVEYPIHQVHLLAHCFLRTSIPCFILLVRLGESRDVIEPLCFFFFFSKLKSTHGWKDRVKRRRELEAMNNGSERRI